MKVYTEVRMSCLYTCICSLPCTRRCVHGIRFPKQVCFMLPVVVFQRSIYTHLRLIQTSPCPSAVISHQSFFSKIKSLVILQQPRLVTNQQASVNVLLLASVCQTPMLSAYTGQKCETCDLSQIVLEWCQKRKDIEAAVCAPHEMRLQEKGEGTKRRRKRKKGEGRKEKEQRRRRKEGRARKRERDLVSVSLCLCLCLCVCLCHCQCLCLYMYVPVSM